MFWRRGDPCQSLSIFSKKEEGRLSAMAVFYFESQRLTKLKAKKEEFYSDVIDVFRKKYGPMDVICK